jgi:hypothetical protein
MWLFLIFLPLILFVIVLRFGKPRSRGGIWPEWFTDGKGPAVRWWPRSLRPWVNERFMQRGWPAPYDDNLNLIPRNRR